MTPSILVELVIFGENISKEELDKITGVNSSYFNKKGQKVNSPFSKDSSLYQDSQNVEKEDCWGYCIEEEHNYHLDEVFDRLINTFNYSEDNLKEYMEDNDLEGSVNFIVNCTTSDLPSVNFNLNHIEFCSGLKLEIDVDLYIDSDKKDL